MQIIELSPAEDRPYIRVLGVGNLRNLPMKTLPPNIIVSHLYQTFLIEY